MTHDYTTLQRDFAAAPLDELHAASMPFDQFCRWFKQALTSGVREPGAMALATADATGRPSVRMVLLRDMAEQGFVFFTDTGSRKAQELATNPQVALLFYWPELERQIRIEGAIAVLAEAEADRHFTARAIGHQRGVWASEQSREVTGRAVLEARFADMAVRFPDTAPRPPHWQGYRVMAEAYEFWQGRRDRIHDRIAYRRHADGWRMLRLAP